jgi:putative PIN family toxin of toxin-antitoxin system
MKRRWVVDTNVLVSALLKPTSTSGRVVGEVTEGRILLLHDARILSEYRNVLARPRLGFDALQVSELVDLLELLGEPVSSPPLARSVPDSADLPFLEVAVAGSADVLVTGNHRHFPPDLLGSVRVLSPSDAVSALREGLLL